jgi:hypothetical protein
MAAIIEMISSDPKAGDVMVGTGGARKLRFAAGGTGKRGGVRTVHYFGPVLGIQTRHLHHRVVH